MGTGRTYLLQDATAYSSAALADSVRAWFAGGPAARGSFERSMAYALTITNASLLFGNSLPRSNGSLEIGNLCAYAKAEAVDNGSVRALALNWAGSPTPGFFPEYFRHDGGSSTAIAADEIPPDIDLGSRVFPPPVPWGDVVSPTGASSGWIVPEGVPGVFRLLLNDASRIRYAWYRFVDQPSIQGLGWSEAEKALVQSRVEENSRGLETDEEFLPPPLRRPIGLLRFGIAGHTASRFRDRICAGGTRPDATPGIIEQRGQPMIGLGHTLRAASGGAGGGASWCRYG